MPAMEIHCRPLDRWPREFTAARKRSPFKSTWDQTLRKLRGELRHLAAATVVVQTAFPESAISVTTGWPRPDRRADHPGVIVAADTKHGALKWVCDDCQSWRDNVHAIALTLERLRLADLYGVTRRGEQYAGWRMLPGPITAAAAAPAMSIEEAARFVCQAAGGAGAGAPAALVNSRPAWERAYRVAAARLHPDVSKDPAAWQRLQDAAALLNSLHNRK